MVDFSKYECPFSHIEKELGHELHEPDRDIDSIWCTCGFRAPLFCSDPEKLGLKLKSAKLEPPKASTELNLGDLVWSEYYSKLGVVRRIISDLPEQGYTVEDPGYDLCSVSDTTSVIVHGIRSETRTNYRNRIVIYRLIKLADGNISIHYKQPTIDNLDSNSKPEVG